MDNKLSIKVKIVDRFYPLIIDMKEEEKVRLAAKLINDKVIQYKQKYKHKDLVDFLAMAALQFATKTVEDNQNEELSQLKADLTDVNKVLSEYLNN